MDYTSIPEQLIYREKSIDRLAKLHPFNATLIKRLLKIKEWSRAYSRESAIYKCVNNAYYISTMMRLEFDPVFRENSYRAISRNGFIEGVSTIEECVTISLVIILIEHSTSAWHQKLQETANDLREIVSGLEAVRENCINGDHRVINLQWIPDFLSEDVDESLVLPDELFQPRTIDDSVILDLKRHNITFDWDRWLYSYHEDDLRELVACLGKTQEEKAVLLWSMWEDISTLRERLGAPIKSTWLLLKDLAQEFCPDYIDRVGLDNKTYNEPLLTNNNQDNELRKVIEQQKTRISELEELLKTEIPEVTASQKVSMEFARILFEKAGITQSVLDIHGNRAKAGTLMGTLINIPPKTCAQYLSDLNLSHNRHRGTISKVNDLLSELKSDVRI